MGKTPVLICKREKRMIVITSLNVREVFLQCLLLIRLSWVGSSETGSFWRLYASSTSRCFQESEWILLAMRWALPIAWALLFPGLHSYRSTTIHFPDSWHIPLCKNLTSIFYQHKPAQQNVIQHVSSDQFNSVTPRYIWIKLASIYIIVPYAGRHNISRYIGCMRFLHSLQKGRNPAWT